VERDAVSRGADAAAAVPWCIETINASAGGIAVAACARSDASPRDAPSDAPAHDLHGTLARGTHSAPRRVTIAGDVAVTVRCHERDDVVRVFISHALYAACASWAHGNVHVAVAGGVVVITVCPFTRDGSRSALSMVQRSTRDVLHRHRAFEYAPPPSPATLPPDAVAVPVTQDAPPPTPERAEEQQHVIVRVDDGSVGAARAEATTTRRRRAATPPCSEDSDASCESTVVAKGAQRRRRRGAPRDGVHLAQRYAYMLLFMLGTVAVAVLSVYIVFFGSLDFTLQTGIAFTRV